MHVTSSTTARGARSFMHATRRHSARAPLFTLGLLLALGCSSSGGDDKGSDCQPGELGCACTGEGTCSGRLSCVDGVCEASGSGGASDPGAAGSTEPGAGGSTDGSGGTGEGGATVALTCVGTPSSGCGDPGCDALPGCTVETASSCSGAATVCSAFDNKPAACQDQLGCTTPLPANTGVCTNVITSCASYNDDDDCIYIGGCRYNASTGSCTGTVVTCTDYWNSATCEGLGACRWTQVDVNYCNGVPVACADLPAASCALQDGCTAVEASCTGAPTPCAELEPERCTAQPGCRLEGAAGVGGATGAGGATGVGGSTARYPDLVVQSFSPYASEDADGPTWGFSVRETNRGVLAAPTHACQLVFSTDTTIGNEDDIFLMDLTGALELSPGEIDYNLWSGLYALSAFTEDIVPSGTYYVGVVLDVDDQVQESEEQNNWAISEEAFFFGTPDYDMAPSALVPSATSLDFGQSFEVVVTVQNLGNQPLTQVPIDLVVSSDDTLSDDDLSFCSETATVELAVGEEAEITLTCTAPRLRGEAFLGVQLNAAQVIFEGNYADNSLMSATPLTVVAPEPDLLVSQVSTDVVDIPFQGAVTFTATVENTGVDPTSSFGVGFYLSSDATWSADDTLVCDSLVSGGITAEGTADLTESCDMPDSIGGTYRVIAVADHEDTVFELDETNNALAAVDSLDVAPPDWDLSCGALGDDAGTPIEIGQVINYNLIVRNPGTATIEAFDLRVVFSTDATYDSGDTEICTLEMPEAVAGAENGYQFHCTVPEMDEGAYFTLVMVDPDDALVETDETNNTSLEGEVPREVVATLE